MYQDETKYMIDTLERCKTEGHPYYVHSKNISHFVEILLQRSRIFVYRGYGYTYICLEVEKDEALQEMPLKGDVQP